MRKGVLVLLLLPLMAQAQTTNRWASGAGFGKWEDGSKWEAGAPSPNHSINIISANVPGGGYTVTIDATTALSNTINSCLTISNLTISGNLLNPKTLALKNTGNAFTILNTATISSFCDLIVTNATLSLGTGNLLNNGFVSINNGTLNALGSYIGYTGAGALIVSNSTFLGTIVRAGFADNTTGTITFHGGTFQVVTSLYVGNGSNSFGAFWMKDGQLIGNGACVPIGATAPGFLTVSNGTWQISEVELGAFSGVAGTLTLAGGVGTVPSALTVGAQQSATGRVWITGGQLNTVGSGEAVIGNVGDGHVVISNGAWNARAVTLSKFGGSRGTLTIAGGTANISNLTVAAQSSVTGHVWMSGGTLVTTNTPAVVIGATGKGLMTLSNGLWQARNLTIGDFVGAQGTLTIAGGTNRVSANLDIGYFGTGTVWVTGGRLETTDGWMRVSAAGRATLTLSNGFIHAGIILVAQAGIGHLTMVAGRNLVTGGLTIGGGGAAQGFAWLTGAMLVTTNAATLIGNAASGEITVSNGTWLAREVKISGDTIAPSPLARGTMTMAGGTWRAYDVFVGFGGSSRGTLAIAGGTSSIFSNLILGNANCGETGIVSVTGGSLFVTNATGNAVLEVRGGALTINSGTLAVDKIVLTNACARFVRTGGTLIYGAAVLNPADDTDGDGLSNGYEQANGLDPLDPFDDADGDGAGNLQELLAGTNPTNSASFFGITVIAREGDDIRVVWMTAAGKTNAIERTTAMTGGFAGLTNIVTTGTTTNFLDLGAATNVPAFFYRVRLVP